MWTAVPAELPLGLEIVGTPGSADVPAYWVPYDKDGACLGPGTAAAAAGSIVGATDVFLMSHGWNNDVGDARDLYRSWIRNLLAVRPAVARNAAPGFRPVFIGVLWPSMVAPGEEGAVPRLAGGPAGDPNVEALLEELSGSLDSAAADRLRHLLSGPPLDETTAREVAGLVLPLFAAADADLPDADTAEDGGDVMAEWRVAQDEAQQVAAVDDEDGELLGGRAPRSPVGAESAGAPDDPDAAIEEPVVAGWLDKLNPVWLLRLGSVLVMKDRSGRVGANGVSDLLDALLGANPNPLADVARVHLVGHSYGCKVLLSALCLAVSPRPVDSVLLLQPAFSARAFSVDAGAGAPGGYRPALQRCRSAIVATYSRHDFPLTKLFHLAARRASDLGDVVIAAGGSKYAALGGFGPQLVDELRSITGVVQPPRRYDTAGAGRILAVDGSEVIGGHGDIGTPATAWMLNSQLGG